MKTKQRTQFTEMNVSDASIQEVWSILDLPAVDVHFVTPTDLGPQKEPSESPYNQNKICLSTPFQPKNFKFRKKAYGKQLRSFQSSWLDLFPWIHYNEANDSVLCFICAKQNAKNYLLSATKKEQAFISDGYILTGKKHSQGLKSTNVLSVTSCQLTTKLISLRPIVIFTKYLMNKQKKVLKSNRRCFIKIIECLKYMSRLGEPLQGDVGSESNFIQFVKLRSKDDPALLEWIQRKNTE